MNNKDRLIQSLIRNLLTENENLVLKLTTAENYIRYLGKLNSKSPFYEEYGSKQFEVSKFNNYEEYKDFVLGKDK